MAAQVKTVTARQEYKCTRCGDLIKPGTKYRYFKPGFRSRIKIRRCMKPECTPKMSELDTSKMSGAYAAIEEAEAAVSAAGEVSEVMQAIEDCEAAIRDVQDEYEQAVDDTPMLEEQVRPKIDALESFADDLSSFQPEEPDEDTPQDALAKGTPDIQQELDELLQQAKEEALDLLSGLEV